MGGMAQTSHETSKLRWDGMTQADALQMFGERNDTMGIREMLVTSRYGRQT